MPLFTYKAKKVSGEQIEEIIEAESIKAVSNKLQSAGYFPISIKPFENKTSLKEKISNFRFKKISNEDIVLFTRRLADALKGGLPLARALGVLERQTENKEFARVTKEIVAAVQEGQPLSEAIRKYPNIFSYMYIGMIKAGESAGLLELVLTRLAEFNEKEKELRYRINSALAYPMVMLFVGIVSVLFLLAFVIPKFEIMFQDIGQSIPLPTKILILCSKILKNGWWFYIPAIIFSAVFVNKFYKTEKGILFFSKIKLKLPLLGNFIKKDLISRFIRMLSILLDNGVPILDALAMTKNSIGNQLFAYEIEKISQSVKEGHGLVQEIHKSDLFPPMVAEMIAVGEETGNLESSLMRIADIYDKEVEYAIKTFTSLLEPVIILAAGFIVCFIALSMLLPVFQMSMGIR